VHTLNQTANFEVHVSLLTFLHSSITIIPHTSSISTCTCDSSIYIKGLMNYFVLFLATAPLFLWTQKNCR